MSEDITKQRSPNAPSVPLEIAIETARRLYGAIRSAQVRTDVAAKALGYSGMNGAALTTLGILSQYGLIDRSKGEMKIAALAMRILHPLSDEKKVEAIQESALSPRVFEELNEGFGECAESVIENHLIHQGFSPERARVVVSVYTKNRAFANLSSMPKLEVPESPMKTSSVESKPTVKADSSAVFPSGFSLKTSEVRTEGLLAKYTIPLGANEATLVFTGESLSVDDFDALLDFVAFSKRQFERALKNPPKIVEVTPPREVSDDYHGQHGAPYKPGA